MSVSASLAQQLNAALPQTQCTRCGYPACLPYAEALAAGEAKINQCPPGGAAGIARLAEILGLEPLPLDPAFGEERAVEVVAEVIEADCIGCTKCIAACPVDAISGGPNLMHTIIESECTGCELCIPPCPVDCIVLVSMPALAPAYERAAHSLTRYTARETRLQRWAAEDLAARAVKKQAAYDPVAAALARSSL